MRYLMIIALCFMVCGCAIAEEPQEKQVEKQAGLQTTLTGDELLVEWQEDGLHRRFWIDLEDGGYTFVKYKVAYLKERQDGYVDHYTGYGFWKISEKVNANPWAEK